MTQNLVIRADANSLIGTGHLMRCLALAQRWHDHDGEVTFLSHCQNENLRQRILHEGFNFSPIDKPHPHPNDLKKTLLILSDLTHPTNNTWLVLDGYHFNANYQKAIRECRYKLLVIDDMAHLDHYCADILLNQNFHASTLNYSCDNENIRLLGCDYVMLRLEFLKYRNWKRHTPRKAKKILVTLGGADPDNVTLKVIQALNRIDDPELEVKVVVGPANPNINSLKMALAHPAFNIHFLYDVSDMPGLMAWADLAVSAAGSTCWEMAFMGLPNCMVILADNQISVAEMLHTQEVSVNMGWAKSIELTSILQIVSDLMQDKPRRRDMSNKGRSLVSGQGSGRVIHSMLNEQHRTRYG